LKLDPSLCRKKRDYRCRGEHLDLQEKKEQRTSENYISMNLKIYIPHLNLLRMNMRYIHTQVTFQVAECPICQQSHIFFIEELFLQYA
jgi:hypothetical protein